MRAAQSRGRTLTTGIPHKRLGLRARPALNPLVPLSLGRLTAVLPHRLPRGASPPRGTAALDRACCQVCRSRQARTEAGRRTGPGPASSPLFPDFPGRDPSPNTTGTCALLGQPWCGRAARAKARGLAVSPSRRLRQPAPIGDHRGSFAATPHPAPLPVHPFRASGVKRSVPRPLARDRTGRRRRRETHPLDGALAPTPRGLKARSFCNHAPLCGSAAQIPPPRRNITPCSRKTVRSGNRAVHTSRRPPRTVYTT